MEFPYDEGRATDANNSHRTQNLGGERDRINCVDGLSVAHFSTSCGHCRCRWDRICSGEYSQPGCLVDGVNQSVIV